MELRALNLAALSHPALIDHYLSTSLETTRLVVVRLLGGRGHWSYGLERLGYWAADRPGRRLVVLAGTAGRGGGPRRTGHGGNLRGPRPGRLPAGGGRGESRPPCWAWLSAFLWRREPPPPPQAIPAADPRPHDWRQEPGPRVGVILYRAQRQAGDLDLVTACLQALRAQGLCPRALWVSSLRDARRSTGRGRSAGA